MKSNGTKTAERSARLARLDELTQEARKRETFSADLLQWYEKYRRDLPWRRTSDPYHIWISEIMLQQTRVETVIPYYERFLDALPTLKDLASVPEERLLSLWSGLGYYSRARNLKRAARQILEHHRGEFPRDRDSVLKLAGVGPYTSAAVLSIAFNEPHAVVDGNVLRVLSRILLIDSPLSENAQAIEPVAHALLDPDRASDHNQAMMELGARVCLPNKPSCLACPVQSHCLAYGAALTAEYPPPKKKKSIVEVEAALLWLADGDGRFALVRGGPFLPHLWMPPTVILSERQARPEGSARPQGSSRPQGSARSQGVARPAVGKSRSEISAELRQTAIEHSEQWVRSWGLELKTSPIVCGDFRHSITFRRIRIQVVFAEVLKLQPDAVAEVGEARRQSIEAGNLSVANPSVELAWYTDTERESLGQSSIAKKAVRLREDAKHQRD